MQTIAVDYTTVYFIYLPLLKILLINFYTL